ncbi:Glyco_hydro_28 domain-containing protein, partial [Cephalotus follicularis]
AFSKAWDAACRQAGNATFYVPEGTFLIGPVSFSGPCYNNQSPNVEIKGTLMAPVRLNAFPHSNWIVFKNLNRISVTGGIEMGKIDGQGAAEAWKQVSCSHSMRCDTLVTSLKFTNVSSGTISNIALANSKAFHLVIHNSDDIHVYDVKITAPGDSPNTDGIHISQSTNIYITSSNIGVGDDCISIGQGSNNIIVSNVTCGPGHGISVGSLGKSSNEKDVTGIHVRNCTINGTQNGIRIKTWPGAPVSSASNLTYEDIAMINVSNPIILDQEYCPSRNCTIFFVVKPSLVMLSNIIIKNITGTYNSNSAVALLCSTGVPCENIQLVDINLNNVVPENTRQGRLSVKGILNGLQVINSTF